jgi:hypothetical protein
VAPPRRDWDPGYVAKKAQLPQEPRQELDLIEERIVTDPKRTYQRTFGDDGVIVDVSGFDEFGFGESFLPRDDTFLFIGFTLDADR